MASVGSPTEVVQPAGQSVALHSTMDLFAAPQVELDRAAEPVSMTVETAVPLGQDQTMEAAEEPAPVRHELVLGVSSEGSLLAPPEENGRPEPNAISQMVNNIRSSFSRDTHTDKVTPAASRRLLFETQELSQSVSLPALPPSSEADPRENDFVLVMTPPADTSNPPPLPTKTIEEYMQGWQREKRTPTLGGGWSAMVTLKVETAVSPLTDYLRDTLDRCVGVWVGNALLGDGRTAHATLAPTLLFCRMNGLLLFHQMGSKRVPISELFLSVVRQCDRHPQLSRSVETLYQHILWYGRLPACPWQLGQSYKGSAVLSLPRDWLLWTCRVCRHKLLHGKVSLSQVHGYDESQEESTASVLPYLVSLLGATHLDLSPPLFAILLATALEETTAERSADPLNRVRHFRQLESGSPIPTLYVRGSIHRTTSSSPLYVLLGEGLEEVTSAFCHAVNEDGRKPSLLKMVRTTLKVLVVVFSKLFTAVATSVKDGEMMQLGTAKLCTLTAFIENACGEVESAATLQASQVDLTNNEKSACPTSRGVQQHLLYEDTP
ncbi:hypothetical protein AGDE_13398 [Angomonas deanei]|nr:hypothetical protein AGDE_13398 [Angomonas deanei]|eukprot:EPY22407.1 hypothetical protein AGDE_13398 [Angomonas deanei]